MLVVYPNDYHIFPYSKSKFKDTSDFHSRTIKPWIFHRFNGWFFEEKSATRRKAEEFRHTAGDDSDNSPYFTIIPVTSRPIRSFLQMTHPDRDNILWTFFETKELIKEKRIIPEFPMMGRSPVFPSDLKFPNSKKQKTCPLPSSCG
jgi:hypothetical protein